MTQIFHRTITRRAPGAPTVIVNAYDTTSTDKSPIQLSFTSSTFTFAASLSVEQAREIGLALRGAAERLEAATRAASVPAGHPDRGLADKGNA